ncbi:MAG: preprotein translocase subunit YajC [Tissierellia bacterium]|nr:preprotein translocase subunit YajC [Tissierellia bacterium]
MANAGAAQGLNFSGLILPIAILAIFYFMAIRPQKKREKQIMEMRSNLKVGDEVITIGGMHGRIVKIKDEIVTLELGADRTKIEFSKWAIGSVVKKENENKENK